MSAPISLTSTTANSGINAGSSGSSQLSLSDFLSLMTTQLENQDPTQPVSNADFFAQMAQLGEVQGMNTLTNQGQVQQAQSLMGKTVIATASGTDANGNPESGVVTGVVKTLSIQSGVYYLGVQQANGVIASVPLSGLQAVEQTPDLSGDEDLVGKSVTATTSLNGQTTSVSGTISTVELASGVPSVVITAKGGTNITVPISSLTSIGNTATTSAQAAAMAKAVAAKKLAKTG